MGFGSSMGRLFGILFRIKTVAEMIQVTEIKQKNKKVAAACVCRSGFGVQTRI